ncbi:hypothetical protein [Metabacillus sp. Hm71]|uniref:hypothetical protein n=1 Tax=Metabacillus sp. Hm71 TaxID=3450743 RepID=UPI003F4429CF
MTALIGKKFENGVLIMADRRITYRGTNVFKDHEKKIMALNHNAIFAFAGVKNIIIEPIEEIKAFSLQTNSLEEIEAYSQKLFRASLEFFKHSYPGHDYATVYLLAGFAADGTSRVTYFSSDDHFQKGHPLEFFYKTFPNTEMVYLQRYLVNEIDVSKKNIDYYIRKFSSAIRQINNQKVSKNAYSIYLSKEGLFETEIDENGRFKIIQLEMKEHKPR